MRVIALRASMDIWLNDKAMYVSLPDPELANLL